MPPSAESDGSSPPAVADGPNAEARRALGELGFAIRPHNCFACGELNAHGLHLALHFEPDRCWVELPIGRDFEGWEGIVHGGILTTILDEVMAWSLLAHDTWGVTARISVTFRRPVPVGSRLRADGRVVEARRRTFKTEGRIIDADGVELASAEGLYVAAPEGQKRELKERYGFRRIPGTPESVDRVAVADSPGSGDGRGTSGSGEAQR